MDKIGDPEVLRAELAAVRHEYKTVRLHAGIGYVTSPTTTTAAAPASAPPANAGYNARWARIIYQSEKLKANRRSPPMRRNPLPDL